MAEIHPILFWFDGQDGNDGNETKAADDHRKNRQSLSCEITVETSVALNWMYTNSSKFLKPSEVTRMEVAIEKIATS